MFAICCVPATPASIRVATLLDKPERRVVDLKADYVGTSVPDEFVVGYGLDFDQRYRNLPYIGQLKTLCLRKIILLYF